MRKNSVKNTRINGGSTARSGRDHPGRSQGPPDQSLDQCGRCGSGTGSEEL